MQDHELYRRILGIEAPWYVDSVELKLEAGEIHVHLAALRHDRVAVRGTWIDLQVIRSSTGAAVAAPGHLPIPDDLARRTAALRMREHGVKTVKLPWAEPSSRFTDLASIEGSD